MLYKNLILSFLLLFNLSSAQLPEDLGQNESYFHTQTLNSSGEYLININLSSDTSWEEENNESAVLTLFVNGTYNQDIIIFNGNSVQYYQHAIKKSIKNVLIFPYFVFYMA